MYCCIVLLCSWLLSIFVYTQFSWTPYIMLHNITSQAWEILHGPQQVLWACTVCLMQNSVLLHPSFKIPLKSNLTTQLSSSGTRYNVLGIWLDGSTRAFQQRGQCKAKANKVSCTQDALANNCYIHRELGSEQGSSLLANSHLYSIFPPISKWLSYALHCWCSLVL